MKKITSIFLVIIFLNGCKNIEKVVENQYNEVGKSLNISSVDNVDNNINNGGETVDNNIKTEKLDNVNNNSEIETILDNNVNQIDFKSLSAFEILKYEDIDIENLSNYFYSEEITDEIFNRIYEKSYKKDCTISKDDLRYIRILHIGFDKETHIGELIVNKAIKQDIIDIFIELYKANYPIEKVILIDEYNADDELSMEDNNSSCFNFRNISGSETLSNHSMGLAIDINPLYNPYVKTIDGILTYEPQNSSKYIDRNLEFENKITHDDLCYKLFIEHGFTWGGDWNTSKDYQHFEKNIN